MMSMGARTQLEFTGRDSWLRVHEITTSMERFFTGRELVNTSSRLEWNAALIAARLHRCRWLRAALRDCSSILTGFTSPNSVECLYLQSQDYTIDISQKASKFTPFSALNLAGKLPANPFHNASQPFRNSPKVKATTIFILNAVRCP